MTARVKTIDGACGKSLPPAPSTPSYTGQITARATRTLKCETVESRTVSREKTECVNQLAWAHINECLEGKDDIEILGGVAESGFRDAPTAEPEM